MIIELSGLFANFTENDWQKYHLNIENLISAHRHGWHIFAPSRRVADSISSGCELSRTQGSVFESYIKSKITTVSGQARTSDFTLLCLPDGHPLTPERTNQIAVPLSNFNDLRMVMPFQLITENAENDGAMIEKICAAVGRSLGYSMPMCIDHVHGGGSTTAAYYAKALKQARPTLCIVDSDKRHPSDRLGSTAKAVMAHGNQDALGVVQALILPVREAENLIPLSFLLHVYATNKEILNVITKFHSFKNSVQCKSCLHNIIDYIDFKAGETEGQISCLPDDFKVMMIKLCSVLYGKALTADNFVDISSVRNAIPPISTNLLNNTVQFMNNNFQFEQTFASKFMRAPFWINIEAIIRKVLAFSAASQRLPI